MILVELFCRKDPWCSGCFKKKVSRGIYDGPERDTAVEECQSLRGALILIWCGALKDFLQLLLFLMAASPVFSYSSYGLLR